MVTGRKPKSGTSRDAELGGFHALPVELQRTALVTAREQTNNNKRAFNEKLAIQFEKRQQREQAKMQKRLDDAQEDHIVAIYFYEQFHSERCWHTVEKAKYEYKELKVETKRRAAVKEQILIRLLGLGWVDAHHAWSQGETTFDSKVLFKWLTQTVIPMEYDGHHTVPSEAPLEAPAIPELPKLGTVSRLCTDLLEKDADRLMECRVSARQEIVKRNARGDGDLIAEKQNTTPPKVDGSLVGYRIEMLFQTNSGEDGSDGLDWFSGTVKKVNKHTRKVQIAWDNVHAGDRAMTTHVLAAGNWNTEVAKKNSWRHYIPR